MGVGIAISFLLFESFEFICWNSDATNLRQSSLLVQARSKNRISEGIGHNAHRTLCAERSRVTGVQAGVIDENSAFYQLHPTVSLGAELIRDPITLI